MGYFAQSYQSRHQGGHTKQKCRPKCKSRGLSVDAGEAIEATRLRSPVLRDPYFSRVDAQSLTRQKEAQTASGIDLARATYSFNTATSLACLPYRAFLKAEWGARNQVIEAERTEQHHLHDAQRIPISWQRPSQKTRLLRSTAVFLSGRSAFQLSRDAPASRPDSQRTRL